MENELFYDKKTVWDSMTEEQESAMMGYAEGYKAFLDAGKTERDAVRYLTAKAEAKGFVPFTRGMAVKAGDKFYSVNRNKGIILTVIGKQPLSAGIHLTAAHLDAPRIDVRTVPPRADRRRAARERCPVVRMRCPVVRMRRSKTRQDSRAA